MEEQIKSDIKIWSTRWHKDNTVN